VAVYCLIREGLVLLPKRWGVERSHAGAARFCRLARDDARWAETDACGLTFCGVHYPDAQTFREVNTLKCITRSSTLR
jgi:hypothetical protein